ncbi:MAG: helix-turn-helix domain-containing protein, partial [Candidatus Heimdallarchaeota archaeon]|nr:helix-turn-helix domain-containing protein [Candidatus Heimdallarchaeota archaeon]
MNDDTPNYYGIIPAPVRYDNKLPDGAKILFSEITALSNVKGYCYASNGYFAKLYDKHNVTISRLISQLEKRGHIKTITTKDEKGTNRKIYPLNKNAKGVKQKDITRITKTLNGSNKNAKPYNIKVNTKDNIKDKESVNKLPQQAQPEELKAEKAKVQLSTKNKTLTPPTELAESL